jgi:hypothetical protein
MWRFLLGHLIFTFCESIKLQQGNFKSDLSWTAVLMVTS